jgi:hypothetical protein
MMAALPEPEQAAIYTQWEVIPENYLTLRQVRKRRRKPAPGVRPIAYWQHDGAFDPLYELHQTENAPRSKPSQHNWSATFAARYAKREDADLDAAHALFALNRYAKHMRCSASQARKIYHLKAQLLERFWSAGYCTRSGLAHSLEHAHGCRDCRGGDPECGRCGGTGVYKVAGGKPFWIQFYVIGTIIFSWHLPRDDAPWATTVGVLSERDLAPVKSEVKPISLSPRRHAQYVALISWLLGDDDQLPH